MTTPEATDAPKVRDEELEHWRRCLDQGRRGWASNQVLIRLITELRTLRERVGELERQVDVYKDWRANNEQERDTLRTSLAAVTEELAKTAAASEEFANLFSEALAARNEVIRERDALKADGDDLFCGLEAALTALDAISDRGQLIPDEIYVHYRKASTIYQPIQIKRDHAAIQAAREGGGKA
jgi:chromosome segregation ATPase